MWYKPELVKTEKELEDEELKELLTKKLREDKKKNKKKKKGKAPRGDVDKTNKIECKCPGILESLPLPVWVDVQVVAAGNVSQATERMRR